MSFTVPIDCQCLAVGVAAVLILLSGLIDLKIIIKNAAGQLCYAISCFYACPTLFCIIVSRKKKNRKRLLLVTGINLNGGSGERSSVSAGEDISYFGMKQFWL